MMELPLFSYAYLRTCTAERRNVAFHRHGGCELILVVRGRCRIESRFGVFDGRPGQLLVIPPETSHNQICEEGERNFFCVFQASPALFPQEWRTIDVSGAAWCRRMFLELERMSRSGNPTGSSGLLLCLLEKLGEFESAVPDMHPKLKIALTLLHRNFTGSIDLAEIAGEVGVSPSFLRKLFVARFGEPPVHYLQNLRLERAKVVLRNPYLSVSEVAELCGFENSNYFIRLFRKRFGISPGKARQGRLL